MDPLRVLSIGAGAIGTYIGGSLALQGHEVVFVERPEIAAELASRGLHLTLGDGDHHLPEPQVLPSMEAALSLGDYEVALFALKSYDTPTFIESLSTLHAPLPTILCLSNGVANEPALAEASAPTKLSRGR